MKAAKGGGYRKPLGSEVRRAKESWTETDPVEEARVHEKRMLDSFVAATASLEWLGTHEGWKLLGFDTCAEWWGARVQPVVEALGLAPTKELGQKVIGLIRAEEAALPRAQQRSARELAALVGVSEWAVRTPAPRSSSARNHERSDLDKTSAAGPAASPEGDSPVLGEPVDVDEQASTGTQSPPAADASTTLPHAGVPAVGDQIEERDEEEAAEASADLPAAATTSLPDGDGDPMPEQSQQPGQDSPPVLGSEGFPGRAETDHHRAGVSGGGHAPRDSSLVELEEFEDDDDTAMPSSSSGDPRDEHTPTDLLLMTFDALINLIDHLDAEAVGPLLFPAELEQLHGHVDALAAFVARVSKARFEAMQRTS